MRKHPSYVLSVVSVLALLFTLLLPATAALAKTANWAGEWDSRWRGGGARLILIQDGDRVSGFYSLYGGRIEGVATGRELRGQWIQDGTSGEFIAVQSPDGKNFSARLGKGQWWTGLRAMNDRQFLGQYVDQSTPAITIYHFIATMNALGPGTMELLSESSHLIDWDEIPDLGISQLDYTKLLFDVLNRLTFRVWDFQRSGSGDIYRTVMHQAGSPFSLELTLRKKGQDWFIVPPPVDQLKTLLKELDAQRNNKETRHLEGFSSPRDTIKTLMNQFDEHDPSSIKHVVKGLNLAGMSDLAKQYEAPRLAAYLKRSLQRLGTPIWQEIPDDPKGASPYVHFEHPIGQITVAPTDTDQGTIWQFTPDSLKKIRALYAAIDDMPPSDAPDAKAVPGSLYFLVRDKVADNHPILVQMLGPMEIWQWLGLTLSLTVAYVLGRLVSGWLGRPLLRRFKKNLAEHPFYQWFLIWSLRLLFMGITLRLVDELLGLPEVVELLVLAISWSAIVMSVAILLLLGINLVANRMITLRSIAGHNITLVSLVAGVARVLVTVAAIVLLADVLKIPYQGVLAGLGIGGLAVALAAQSTLQNFISGITLYFDKPIAVGDYCRFGNQEGTVEFIGMRSTRIRTLERTLVTVPNSEFSNMKIESYAKRDRMLMNPTLELRCETTPDQLRFVLAEIKALLCAHPKVADEPLRVRFIGFGNSSLDIEVFAYILTNKKSEFLAIREDVLLRIMTLVENAGTQFAFNSVVSYQATDIPNDAEKTRAAETAVARWREQGNLPFPDMSPQEIAKIRETLDYPPAGSAVADLYENRPSGSQLR